ncbi:phosphatidate cytidylyltransferase [Caulobacter sp. S45]|uniref:phosphatidate cytidylyltransferase n=1 Tax=Caulobacter sp. S45 TaxID=1641861 RepID=UPI00131E28FC|nr:phosphatidate cytidylyltransferase [Caulobacter sp. S45]
MTSLRQARRFDWSNLRVRAVSAAVLAPLALIAVWYGGVAFLVGVWIAVALLALEWGTMSAPQHPIQAAVTMALIMLLSAITVDLGYFKSAWLVICLGAWVAVGMAALRKLGDRAADEGFGVLYLGAPTVALLWLRSGDSGRGWVLSLLAVTWAADIGAFLGGNLFRGPKLWPRISPNKTWSGFFTGLAAAMAVAEAVALCLGRQGGPVVAWAWLAGLIVGLATMAGDLCESMIKRRFGVKDSGSIIPGHGGLLDRVDGLMFATVAMAAVRLAGRYGAFS